MSWDDEWVELTDGRRVRRAAILMYDDCERGCSALLMSGNYTEFKETRQELDKALGRIKLHIKRPLRFMTSSCFSPDWVYSNDGIKIGGAVIYNYPFKVEDIIEIDGEKFCIGTVVNHYDAVEGWRCRIEFRNFKELT